MTVSTDSESVTIKYSDATELKILKFGATAVSWKVDGAEKLWLSENARFSGGDPVRGGIPVVFPRFGRPTGTHPATDKLPLHGFADFETWEYLGSPSETSAQFRLTPANLRQASIDQWGYAFKLVLTLELGARDLALQLEIENTDTKPFDFTTLFHTHYLVDEITKTKVDGFDGLSYYNKVIESSAKSDSDIITFNGPIDNVYRSTPSRHVLSDEKGPIFTAEASASLPDTVVWNPWREGAEEMNDFMPKNGYRRMICVENGSVAKFINLKPAEKFVAGLKITAN